MSGHMPIIKSSGKLWQPHNAILEFEVEIQGVLVNGVDMISWSEAGLITEFKAMVRPLKAASMIHQNMGTMLQAQQ